MATYSQIPQVLRFDVFELDVRAGELRKRGARLRLQGQPLQVLAALLRRQGELVTREELRAEIWPADTFVDFDHSLHNAIARIREALGDSAQSPRFIETLPRRGYRFIGQVYELRSGEATSSAPPADSSSATADQEYAAAPLVNAAGFTHIQRSVGAAVGFIAVVALGFLIWHESRRSSSVQIIRPIAVAVLPFQNESSNKDVDFLRLALADEITTTLSSAHSVSVRPFASTSRYTATDLNLPQIGRELGVKDIVSGHYQKEGEQLHVTLEAIDASNNGTLWRDEIRMPATDLIALRGEIAARVRQEMVPALGATGEAFETEIRPRNEEAYNLYLHSVSLSGDPGPNKEAISMLERAVTRDSDYAPAWGALGQRYLYDSKYDGGGEDMSRRSTAALERALTIDPNYVFAASWLITDRAETGDLVRAYCDARNLVKRRPENAMAHFALSYVLRYASVLDEAGQECDTARLLDPRDNKLRSCHLAFDMMGKPQQAMEYLRLDEGSAWTNGHLPLTLLREGNVVEARESAKNIVPSTLYRRLMKAWLSAPPPADLEQQARAALPVFLADPDPENRYFAADMMAYIGQRNFAVQLLKSAIDGQYCSYTGLQDDVLLAPLRTEPGYAQLLSYAKHCRDKFLAQRSLSSR